MTDNSKLESALKSAYKVAVARFAAAIESVTSEEPYKVYDIEANQPEENRIFRIPMIPFRWEESFEGLHTMLLDDNNHRSICICKSHGSVRLPQYTHRRNERIMVIEGKIIDHILDFSYGPDDTIDIPMNVVRDLEFIDCVFSIVLTPPLDFNNKNNSIYE